MRTQTTDLFLVEDLEDIGRTGELAENRVNDELTEQLVKGHADFFYGYEFAIQGGGEKLPDEVLRYFTSSRTPTSCAAASGSCRAWDATSPNEQRKSRPLAMPVLAIGGAESWGAKEAEHDEARRGRRAVRSFPAAATGSPRRRPRSCWPRWRRSSRRNRTAAR